MNDEKVPLHMKKHLIRSHIQPTKALLHATEPKIVLFKNKKSDLENLAD